MENKFKKGWLIFVTHSIEENPSAFGCTPEYFGEIIKYSIESGASVLPVNEVMNSIKQSTNRI